MLTPDMQKGFSVIVNHNIDVGHWPIVLPYAQHSIAALRLYSIPVLSRVGLEAELACVYMTSSTNEDAERRRYCAALTWSRAW